VIVYSLFEAIVGVLFSTKFEISRSSSPLPEVEDLVTEVKIEG